MQRYPLLPLRGLTVFPYMSLHFDVGREKSVKALTEAMAGEQEIVLVTQRDMAVQDPAIEDLFPVGTICRIKQVLALPGDHIRVLVEGQKRARIQYYVQEEPFIIGQVEPIEEVEWDRETALEVEAMMRILSEMVEELVNVSGKINRDTLLSIGAIEDPGQFADAIASDVLRKLEDKQQILEIDNAIARMEALMAILRRETDVMRIEKRINQRVRRSIDKSQREFYLREQMKAIQKELGEKDVAVEMDELRQKTESLPLSDMARDRVTKEIDRLSRMQSSSPEAVVSRTYIDTILELPWGKASEDTLDLENAEKILDEDHYGMRKVKDRILEYLAVAKLRADNKGPILCLVGPPGTGKTSIARSVARALGRSFHRMSLGGVHDEAEIRGHRRTYIGAIPGSIMEGIRSAGTMNPVFLMDEIDKLSRDFRGDPASAVLEVLDPEQNKTFRDHYLDLDFDLSKVLFITTANTTETIARPLLDRMEIIEVPSYTPNEKLHIALGYLLRKQAEKHGLNYGEDILLEDDALMDIIHLYTSESGVRELERQIATVCRKAARGIASGKDKPVIVTTQSLGTYLGLPRTRHDAANLQSKIGVATGLAWTAVGGTTLQIEVGTMAGTGKIELTGQLGGVMKESALTAISYLRAHAGDLHIDEGFHQSFDLHIHIPEGATPKDGPSAGITLATAVLSALTKRPVRGDIAMTGEITLTGRVLPVGGIREKMLAALRDGIYTVIMPRENERDLQEIDAALREKLHAVFVDRMEDVILAAFVDGGQDADQKN
jgi:ATP-dependent Lon protease